MLNMIILCQELRAVDSFKKVDTDIASPLPGTQLLTNVYDNQKSVFALALKDTISVFLFLDASESHR